MGHAEGAGQAYWDSIFHFREALVDVPQLRHSDQHGERGVIHLAVKVHQLTLVLVKYLGVGYLVKLLLCDVLQFGGILFYFDRDTCDIRYAGRIDVFSVN